MRNPADVLSVLSETHVFDARGVARRFRHAAIFGALDALEPGEVMRFVNNHDPLPLLAQIGNHFGSARRHRIRRARTRQHRD